jgi:hypothetical protein
MANNRRVNYRRNFSVKSTNIRLCQYIIAQKVRGIETKPFGGIQVIAVGEFRQLPPVSNDIDKGQ